MTSKQKPDIKLKPTGTAQTETTNSAMANQIDFGTNIKSREPKTKSTTLPKNLEKALSSTHQVTGAKSKKTIELIKNKLNVRYKGVQVTVDKNTEKRIDQVARKTIRLATKVNDPTFEQKYKNYRRENPNIHATHSMG